MALLVCCADGGWTTAATWAVGDNTSLLRAISNNTNSTTAYVESAAFTPGAITIDAILVRIAARNGTTGTMSVRLAQGGVTVAGTEVTVNMTDIPACGGSTQTTTPDANGEGDWFMFKMAAPVLLVAATLYTVSMKTSTNGQVNLYRDGTAGNWSRILRTTTTQAPAAGDDMVIAGEWTAAATMTARTVTMNETATTDYGSNTTTQATPALAIVKGGTLTWGTTAATNYRLRLSGYAIVYRDGIYNQGTSGTPMPRDSTAELQFDCGADGDFGMIIRFGGTLNMFGLSRTSAKDISWTTLNADLAAAGTSATTTDDTGWKNGDVICVASTTRPSAGSGTTLAETITLTADASGTSLPSFAGVTNAHSGTSPTKAEVGLLTRNVVMKTVTSTNVTFLYVGTTTTVGLMWVEFSGCGVNSTNKWGVTVACTNSFSIRYCSMHDGEAYGIFLVTPIGTCTIDYNVIWGVTQQGIRLEATGNVCTLDHNLAMKTTGSGFELQDVGGVTTNNVATSQISNGEGFSLNQAAAIGTFSGNKAHSGSSRGFVFNNNCTGILDSCTAYYSGREGFFWNSAAGTDDLPTTFRLCDAFGNTNHNFLFNNDSVFLLPPIVLDTCTANGTSGFATTNNVRIEIFTVFHSPIKMYGCDFSSVSGIRTAATVDISFEGTVWGLDGLADNCKLGAATIINNNSSWQQPSKFGMQRLQQVDGSHRTYFKYGVILTNNSVFVTSAPSQEMQPNSASNKLKSGYILAPCDDGDTISISVNVRKSAAYNGNAPRLILERQDSMGVTSDTVCDTLTVAADTWETLTYTTGAALENGVFRFYVDCDGTAGSAYIDDVVIV